MPELNENEKMKTHVTRVSASKVITKHIGTESVWFIVLRVYHGAGPIELEITDMKNG